MSHSVVLVVSYAAVCLIWLVLQRYLPYWRQPMRPTFPRPGRELGWILAGAAGVLVVGQLWSHGIRFPAEGTLAPLAESVNQLLIFAPILLVPVVRRNGLESAWLPTKHALPRWTIGAGLACLALGLFSVLQWDAPSWPAAVASVIDPRNVSSAFQVLLEDIAIALVFVRLSAVIGPRRAIVGVAALFAAGHIPAMFASGAQLTEFLGLVRDFGLGILVLSCIWRGADVLWFWPIHFVLDMTQYLHVGA